MLRTVCLLLLTVPAWAESPPYQPVKNADEASKRIEALGGTVRTVSATDEGFDVDWQGCPDVTNSHLQYVQMLPKLRVVRLRGTAITDDGLVHLAKCPTLKKLSLDRLLISDAGVKHLLVLRELEVLNLYGTSVTDQGIAQLKELSALRSLFVAETKVTATGIKTLQQSLPKLTVLPDLAKDRTQAEAAWTIAKSAVANSEAALANAKKDADEMAPKMAQLKKEADDATKQANDAKRIADEAKKKLDEADKAAKEAKNQAENATRMVKAKPADAKLQQIATEKAKLLDATLKTFAERKAAFDDVEKRRQAMQANAEQLRQMSNRANNAKNRFTDAQAALEAAKLLETDTRQRLEALPR